MTNLIEFMNYYLTSKSSDTMFQVMSITDHTIAIKSKGQINGLGSDNDDHTEK